MPKSDIPSNLKIKVKIYKILTMMSIRIVNTMSNKIIVSEGEMEFIIGKKIYFHIEQSKKVTYSME